LAPRTLQNWSKIHKHALFVTSPRENLESNNVFLIETRRLAESVDGLNCSLAIAAGGLLPKKCRPRSWPARALKGFKRTATTLLMDDSSSLFKPSINHVADKNDFLCNQSFSHLNLDVLCFQRVLKLNQ